MKCGTGSVTAITGLRARSGGVSPNWLAMAPAQAPAQLSSTGARTSSSLPERTVNSAPSCATTSNWWRAQVRTARM